MQDLIHNPAFGMMIFNALVVWPLWRILRRTGLDGRWALLVFVPLVGLALVVGILGHSKWPLLPERGKPLPPKTRRTL